MKLKRILIVNVNWRGDVLFSTPFIRALRTNYPQSFIACLVVPRCYEILVNNPHLDELIIYDQDGRHRTLRGKVRFIFELKRRNFDTAFFLHRSFTRRLLAFFAGIPRRIGYLCPLGHDTRKRGFLLTTKIKPLQGNPHRIDYFLNLAEAVGIKSENRDYEFIISAADQEFADNWLIRQGISEDDFLVIINPGGNWLLKRWPEENFARLADALIKDYGAKIVISGAAKDLKLAQEINVLMKQEAVVSCGQTSLGQLGGILKRANLFISNDSGPLHVALAVSPAPSYYEEIHGSRKSGVGNKRDDSAKVIALFGPTSPKITGPAGKGRYVILHKALGCSIPCYNLNCPDNRCMKAITVEDVLSCLPA